MGVKAFLTLKGEFNAKKIMALSELFMVNKVTYIV